VTRSEYGRLSPHRKPRTPQSMLELYHHGSSVCAAKVRFALAEKALEWTGHYLDILAGEQFRPDYLKINPKAMVPALVHDGRIVVESTVICEYIEDVFAARPIYPEDPYRRAEVRIWTKAVDEDLHPACSAITYVISHRHTIRRNGATNFDAFIKTPSSESIEARKLKWQWIEHGLEAPGAADKIRLYDRYLHKMNAALNGRTWLVGDAFSMADIALTPYANRLAMLGLQEMWQGGRLPHVERWFARIRARPTFKPALIDWIPETLAGELAENGARSAPDVKRLLQIA
jgi:ganglioside-induced differentiation-associated protein 1